MKPVSIHVCLPFGLILVYFVIFREYSFHIGLFLVLFPLFPLIFFRALADIILRGPLLGPQTSPPLFLVQVLDIVDSWAFFAFFRFLSDLRIGTMLSP